MKGLRWISFFLLVLFYARSSLAVVCENNIDFNISAQSLDKALLEFAQQAKVSVLIPGSAYRYIMSNPVKGSYCLEEALETLLLGLKVKAELDESGQLMVSTVERFVDDASLTQVDAKAKAKQDKDKEEAQSFISALASFFTDNGADIQSQRAKPPLPEEIIITGSRVRQVTGMTAPTPVTSVSYSEVHDFNPGTTIAEQLDSLPQFFSTQTAQRGGLTFVDAGGSYLNLRGMGSSRTLVLLNGSRIIPSDSFGSVNVDNFPTALLERVDIVTGGASAAYGADAISGVVNFVLDREYEGFKASVSTGITQRGDGENWQLSLAGGKRFGDNLYVIGSAEAHVIDQINADPDRLDNWQDWGHVRNPQWSADDPAGTNPQRITVPHVFPTRYSAQGLITTPNFKYSNYTFTDDGTSVRPYVLGDLASTSGAGATRTHSGGPEYETWRASTDGGPDSNEVVRRSLFLSAKYDLTDNIEVYGQTMLARTESNAYGLRGNPVLYSIWTATIYQENPFLPELLREEMQASGLDSIELAKRGTVYGPDKSNYYANRGNRNINQLASFSFGFNAQLDNEWNLSSSYQHGKSNVSSSALNILRLDNFFTALDAVADPISGETVCNISVVNPSAEDLKAAVTGELFPSPLSLIGVEVDSPIGPMNVDECAPINIFGLGNVSAEARDWVEDEEKKNYRTLQQDFFELILSGELHEGWGAGAITFASGLSYRAEKFSQASYPVYGERGLANAPELGIRGIPGGFTGPGNRSLHQFSAIGAGKGSFDVTEFFGELNLPMFNLASGQSLGSSLAIRQSNYFVNSPIVSWKAGMDLQLSHDLRWRFTRSRDVREPNFSEQFLSGSGGALLNDPVFNESYVITSISGPNPFLSAEEANTITTGLVYQPSFAQWVSGLQIAVDWYDINLSSAVGRLGAQFITDDCFNGAAVDICDMVQRNPVTNRVDRVIDRYFNVGTAKTSGVDLEVNYFTEPDFVSGLSESFTLRGFVGYLRENSTTTASGLKEDLLNQTNRPAIKGAVTATYSVGPYALSLQQRYIDSTLVNPSWVEGIDVDDNTIASQSISNLGLSYSRSLSSGEQWQAGLNITNLFDKEPPMVPGQTLSNSHDQYGRRFQLSLSVNY